MRILRLRTRCPVIRVTLAQIPKYYRVCGREARTSTGHYPSEERKRIWIRQASMHHVARRCQTFGETSPCAIYFTRLVPIYDHLFHFEVFFHPYCQWGSELECPSVHLGGFPRPGECRTTS